MENKVSTQIKPFFSSQRKIIKTFYLPQITKDKGFKTVLDLTPSKRVPKHKQ